MVDKRELEQGLITSLVQWDNKTTSELELLYPGFVSLNNFTLVLLHLLSDPQTEIGASWLIKHHLDNHQRISAAEIELFFEKYHDLTCWQSRLHWLQCSPLFEGKSHWEYWAKSIRNMARASAAARPLVLPSCS